jgi:DNA polymerase III epsilon subunit-like protein
MYRKQKSTKSDESTIIVIDLEFYDNKSTKKREIIQIGAKRLSDGKTWNEFVKMDPRTIQSNNRHQYDLIPEANHTLIQNGK